MYQWYDGNLVLCYGCTAENVTIQLFVKVRLLNRIYTAFLTLWLRSRRFLGGVGFITALGVGFFCPTPTTEVQLDHFLHHTPKLAILVEMVQFHMKSLLKQIFLAVHHNFH